MCIAILTKPGAIVDSNALIESVTNNPDGFGYAFIHPDKGLTVNKYDIYDDIDFIKDYTRDAELYSNDSPFLLHARIATTGSVKLDNCHPFTVSPSQVMAHNGMIDIVPDKGSDMTDTETFINKVIKQLPKGWHKNPGIVNLVKHQIGWSKLIFLNSDKSYFIVNEALGHWQEGVWYSNSSYKPVTYAPKYTKIDTSAKMEEEYYSDAYWDKYFVNDTYKPIHSYSLDTVLY